MPFPLNAKLWSGDHIPLMDDKPNPYMAGN